MQGELWLIRHGETEWSRSGQHTSRTDLPLTPEGRRSGSDLKSRLEAICGGKRFALVLSSPMWRALDTGRIVGFEPEIAEDLREWDYGEYEGLTTSQIQKDLPGWTIWTGTPPGGETATAVAERADRIIHRALSIQGGPGDTALFGHGHMLRVLAARWIGLEPRAGRFLALSTGSISVLGWEHASRVIRLWNQTA
ncbi:MAG TPA: histidine phosphatase family protein [Bryobacteraceae bacterium]|nr:histidine phosphatase family protein [Bryobacteraceae bacterium]